MVKFEFEWGFQGWLWEIWVGFWVAALPALRVLVCARTSSRQSRSDRQLVLPVVLGLLMGGDWFWCLLSFLVLVVWPFCGWPGCSVVNLECIQCGCLWLGFDANIAFRILAPFCYFI